MAERHGARDVWQYVTKHQGWLHKKGGLGPTGKKWLDRYFVLYSTAMGHFLSYYEQHSDSPLFSNARKERNLIDLAKVTFIRPVSNQPDAPPFSFDVVTIEREWTLSAPNEDAMQLWLQLLTKAVDEDVAIVPDDELCFEVKCTKDPTDRLMKYDYSTLIKVSANGVSVGTKNGKSEYYERFFWCYTDFYKWSVQNLFGKLTLFCSVFTSTDFSQQSKQEMEFRSRQAIQLASAIEFYIEKFMSIMYLKNEGRDNGNSDNNNRNAAAEDFDEDDYEHEHDEEEEEEEEEVEIQQTVDLLSLGGANDDDNINNNNNNNNSVPMAQAVAVSANSNDTNNLPVARTSSIDAGSNSSNSLDMFGVAPPAPPPASAPPTPAPSGGSFDPFSEMSSSSQVPPALNTNISISSGFDDAFGTSPVPSPASASTASGDDLLATFTEPGASASASIATPPPPTKHASALALGAMESANIPAFNRGKKEGVLYSEGNVLNVMLKQEWRGSQGRVSLCYVNASSSEIIVDLKSAVIPKGENENENENGCE